MTRRAAWTLIASALWTWWVWGTRIWNVLGDDERSTGFKVVHVVLALVSVGFAVAVFAIGRRGLRGAARR